MTLWQGYIRRLAAASEARGRNALGNLGGFGGKEPLISGDDFGKADPDFPFADYLEPGLE